MARLPQPGSDGGIWGDVLNDFLSVSHSADGALKTGSITNDSIADGTLTSSKLVNNTITGTKLVNGTITDVQIASANIDGAAGVPSLRTLGTGANQAMPGNAVIAIGAHAATHRGNGSDPIAVASTTVSGLMSNSDKVKLDGLGPAPVDSVNGQTGVVVLTQDNVGDGATYKQYSQTEKTKLAGIATGATANATDAQLRDRSTHTGTQAQSTIINLTTDLAGKQPIDSDLTDIGALSPSNDDVIQRKSGAWTNRTPAQLKLDLSLTKSDVGLGNVDNTSDATKNSTTATLTNKRITPRVLSITSSATPTINTDDYDAVSITALATAITSMTTNLSGAPTNFQKLMIRIKDDGTARAITWGASFEAKGVVLPTTTVISKVLTVGFVYDSISLKWGCVASVQET